MSVRLRIVGIYFNRDIDLEVDETTTIFNLLDKARRDYPILEEDGIDFVTTTDTKPSITSFMHNYSGEYDYDGDGVITMPPDGKTLGNKMKPARTYKLDEQKITGGVLGWQYYVQRGGRLVSGTPVDRGFNSYAYCRLEDGDVVTWRLVAIGKESEEEKSLSQRLA